MNNATSRPSLIHRYSLSRAIACVACLALWAAPLCAKGDGSKDGSKTDLVKTESGSELELDFSFANAFGSGSSLDFGPDSGGPELGVSAWTKSRFGIERLPWLRTGPEVSATGELGTDVITPSSGEPYLVISDVSLLALAGWGADAKFHDGIGELEFGAALLGGLGLYDLNEADVDYLASGALAENFWYRVEPNLGVDAFGSYKASSFEARFYNRYLSSWDALDAYGSSWPRSFAEACDLKISFGLLESGPWSIKARFLGELSIESRLIEPVLKYSTGLRLDLGRKRVGELKLKLVEWSYKAKAEDFAFSSSSDVERQLSGGLQWDSELGEGEWKVGLTFPWWADDSGETCPGTWKLAISRSLGD